MTMPRQAGRAIPNFPSNAAESPQGHAFMLARDIPLGILPIRGARDRESFDVTLEGADEDDVAWFQGLLGEVARRGRSLDGTLVEFTEKVSTYIAHFGVMHMEIVPGADEAPPSLTPMPPGRVWRTRWGWFQVVPRADRKGLEAPWAVRLPVDSVWRFSLPSELGSARQHRRTLNLLGRWSLPIPPFALESPGSARESSYDVTLHRRACDREMERATNRWGTIPSVFRVEGATEYFLVARNLSFRRAQALLREQIVRDLNGLLAHLGRPHEIRVRGIPTSAEIDVCLRRLQAGDVSFREALEETRM